MHRVIGRLVVILGMAVHLPFLMGCAEWTNATLLESTDLATSTPNRLPAAKIGSDTWRLDTAFVPITSDAEENRLWECVDETVISPGLRRDLMANGLRAGKLIGQPVEYLAKLDPDQEPLSPIAVLDKAGVASELSHVQRQLHARPGQVYPMPTRTGSLSSTTVLLYRDGSVSGKTLASPYACVDVTLQPKPTGQVLLRLQPVIEHGEYRQNWIGQDQAIVKRTQRDRLPLENLLVEIPLTTGEVVVFGSADPSQGLGRLMLEGQSADGTRDRTVLLVRLAGAAELPCELPAAPL